MLKQLPCIFLMLLCGAVLTIGPGCPQNFAFAQEESVSGSIFSNVSMNMKEDSVPFKAELGHYLSDGVTVTAAGSVYPIMLTPITLLQGTGTRSGNHIMYAVAPGVRVIYSFRGNGVKEEIVFDNPSSAPREIAFRLGMDPMLEARLDSKGNVLIYGPNSILSNYIQTGDAKSAELIMKARLNAVKDNLLYIIPAPVIIDGAGSNHTNSACYTLEKSILTLHTGAIEDMPAPVSIDPSIVVTTTADFLAGNNEGLISFDTDAVSRAIPGSGSIGAWTATTSFPTAREHHASAAYNGYLYVIGGYNGTYLNDVRYAPINANGTIGTWTATTSFPTGRSYHISVVYNGYLYIIGGSQGTGYLNDVQFAPINANGTVGTWTATSSFTTGRFGHTSVVYNGYLYVIGGTDATSRFNDVQFAPINANGTVGTWAATTSFTTGRSYHTSVVYNGYLYVICGYDATYTYLSDVQYAAINANGTVSSWTATTGFPTTRALHASVVNNGNLYVIGGYNGAYLNDVHYAAINANGTIGTWVATTSFPTARADHASVVYNGYLYITGGYSSSYLNDVHYAPINAYGSVGSWTATTSFTTARRAHTSLAYNGYLYLIGGRWASGYLNDVRYAPINGDGTIGAWIVTTSFTSGRSGHTSVIYNGYLYVIGGWNNSAFNDVQYAPINANGTVGTWTATTSFATARHGHTSVINNGYLYVIGGNSGSGYLSDVQYAPINANGTVGTWATTTSLPGIRSYHTSVAYSGYLYVIGGYNGTNLNDVRYAVMNANGTIGSWTATTSFPTGRSYHTSVINNGYLYVIGGWDGTSYINDVQYALINANGTVGTWIATVSFPTARDGHASLVNNGYLYVIGGESSTSYLNDVQFAPINAKGTVGTLGAWSATTSFPTARNGHASVAYNGYLYVIAGANASSLGEVQYAPINANGTVGSWTATTSITPARYGHTSVVYNGNLYVIGGSNSGICYNDVFYAQINTNGSLGTWTATTGFNTARYRHTSVVHNGNLYVIGGETESAYFNDVQYAPINADGTVGTWTATTSFTTGRSSHGTVLYNGKLYVIGGTRSAGPLNDVQYAPINTDGTVGTWTATTSFPTARYSHTSVAYDGYLYVLGGRYGATDLNDVQYAPINNDGTVGTWTATTSFPTARSEHASLVYNGYVYVIGGRSGGYLSDVRYTMLIGQAARARYSKLLDIGSNQIVQSIQFTNSSTKGITNLTYAVAPSSTAVFGSRTTISGAGPGVPYATGLNTCGRYMWVHFDLDDTASATTDNGGVNGRGNILDFTITYNTLTGVGSSLLASRASSNVYLTWSASPAATSYNVLRCTAASGPCTPVTVASPTGNSYSDPVLGDSFDYWYLIQAVNGTCISP